MAICSILIIGNIFINQKNNSLRNVGKRSRSVQIFFILLATNGLFICLVSPLVFLNAIGAIEEGTNMTTIAYILAYANHG